MNLDVRVPAGLMFLVMGLLLAGYGAVADPTTMSKSLGMNIDLIWGSVLVVMSLCLLTLAFRSRGRS